MKPLVTVHVLIKNEDRWIWYTLMSVLDYVDKILIYDTGSTDRTIDIIKSIDSPQIILESHPISTRQDLVKLRRDQLERTTTPWFMLLDGDEIWPQANLFKLLTAASAAPQDTMAFFTRTRNCVGDVHHYLPESKGHYQIKGITGHLNIRLIRKVPNLKITGQYPLEAYTLNGQSLQSIEDRIEFVDTWYLHTTHLPRSTQPQSETNVIDRLQKRKFWRPSLKIPKSELPEIFWQSRPAIVSSPITNRWTELIRSLWSS